jgi:hypothetical protein
MRQAVQSLEQNGLELTAVGALHAKLLTNDDAHHSVSRASFSRAP